MTIFDETQHPRASSGAFAFKPQSSPELTIGATTLADLPVSARAAAAALAATAGGHSAILVYRRSERAAVDGLVNEMARLTGKRAYVIGVDATEFRSTRPDEILVLEEPAEMSKKLLDRISEGMRQSVFSQAVILSKVCPCGDAPDCDCPEGAKRRYRARVPGNLVDHFSVQANVTPDGEASSLGDVDSRLAIAKSIQEAHLRDTAWSAWNEVSGEYLRSTSNRLPAEVTVQLDGALERGGITMRGYDRLLRVAWTTSALDGRPIPNAEDVSAALTIRRP